MKASRWFTSVTFLSVLNLLHYCMTILRKEIEGVAPPGEARCGPIPTFYQGDSRSPKLVFIGVQRLVNV